MLLRHLLVMKSLLMQCWHYQRATHWLVVQFLAVLAGVTGSASGGMSIALASFADTFSKQAEAMGISHQVLHRVVAVASGGMDTLPHNGAVITLLAVTGMTHKESYVDIGMNTVIIPLISCVVIIILGSIGIC